MVLLIDQCARDQLRVKGQHKDKKDDREVDNSMQQTGTLQIVI